MGRADVVCRALPGFVVGLEKHRVTSGQGSTKLKLRAEHLSDIRTRIGVGAANNAHRSGTPEEHTGCRCCRQVAVEAERTWAYLRHRQTSWEDYPHSAASPFEGSEP